MNHLINVYFKNNDKWVYEEGTRMHKTLVACKLHYKEVYGVDVMCKFA